MNLKVVPEIISISLHSSGRVRVTPKTNLKLFSARRVAWPRRAIPPPTTTTSASRASSGTMHSLSYFVFRRLLQIYTLYTCTAKLLFGSILRFEDMLALALKVEIRVPQPRASGEGGKYYGT